MLNGIWIFLVVVSLIAGAFSGHIGDVTTASVEWAKKAVTLAIGLVGVMAFWLGMMRVARDAGILTGIARALRPVMSRLFPDIPVDHPAMSAMIMNISANMLGLANAATPFGIKAMEELDKLNPQKGTATNAMCLFLAINTSNVSILPLGVMGIRAAVGSEDIAGIVPTTILATVISTTVAIIAAKVLSRTIGRSSDPGTLKVEHVESTDGSEAIYADDDTIQTQLEAREARAARPIWRQRLVWTTVAAIAVTLIVGLVRNIVDPSSLQAFVVDSEGLVTTETVERVGISIAVGEEIAVTEGYVWEPWNVVGWQDRPKAGIDVLANQLWAVIED